MEPSGPVQACNWVGLPFIYYIVLYRILYHIIYRIILYYILLCCVVLYYIILILYYIILLCYVILHYIRITCLCNVSFLGAFTKLRKKTTSLVMSVSLSVRQSVCPRGTTHLPRGGFSRNLIFEDFLQNLSRKFKFN